MVFAAISNLVICREGMEGRAEARVLVPPAKVYELVSDVTRMGERSPECRRCQWLDEGAAPIVGTRFRGHNRRGLFRWSMNRVVTTFEPGRVFAFEVSPPGGPPQTRWRYEVEPAEGGTILKESFQVLWYWRIIALMFFGGRQRRLAQLEQGLRRTRERIKAVSEDGGSN